MNKMVMITYNEAMDDEVMEILQAAAVKGYTKTAGAYGMGQASGTHRGDDIWPGLNNILYVVCDDAQVKQLLSEIKKLRTQYPREGIKAFVLPVEELT